MALFVSFNDTATTEIYTLSLHDALPISGLSPEKAAPISPREKLLRSSTQAIRLLSGAGISTDRKSTRLNSSHANISYAVFCLKKKKKQIAGCLEEPDNTHPVQLDVVDHH